VIPHTHTLGAKNKPSLHIRYSANSGRDFARVPCPIIMLYIYYIAPSVCARPGIELSLPRARCKIICCRQGMPFQMCLRRRHYPRRQQNQIISLLLNTCAYNILDVSMIHEQKTLCRKFYSNDWKGPIRLDVR
jgi:hypothetical protein